MRFTPTVRTVLRLKPKMGHQRPARQLQREKLSISVVVDVCYWLGRVDERGIAHTEVHGLIVLNYRRFASDLKYSVIVLHIVEPNIPLRSFNTGGIAGNIYPYEAAYGSGSRSTSKGLVPNSLWVIPPPLGPNRFSPTFVI